MAAPLTQEKWEDYLPGSFGYQPALCLLELVSVIADFAQRFALCPHALVARLPTRNSRVGRFLADFRLPQILKALGLELQFSSPSNAELGDDDPSRHNLIPMTGVRLSGGVPDFKVLRLEPAYTFARAFANANWTGLAALPKPVQRNDSFLTVAEDQEVVWAGLPASGTTSRASGWWSPGCPARANPNSSARSSARRCRGLGKEA
jgi:hypothetical protein